MTSGESGTKQRECADNFDNRDPAVAHPPGSAKGQKFFRPGRTPSVEGRPIGGIDVAEWLVRNGLALDWPLYSKGKYDKSQSEAAHAGRGIWAGSYVAPWLFRACIRQGGKPDDCSDDANLHP